MLDANVASASPSDEGEQSRLLTFLIADVRGYTRYTQEHGDEAAAALADRFAGLIDEVVTGLAGQVVELRGDEALCVFASARQALRAATTFQARCAEEMELDPALHLRVGIGLDAGEAVPLRGGFRGGALNLAARLCALAGAGEVLSSSTVIDLAGKIDDLSYLDRGPMSLKGFARSVAVVQVRAEEGIGQALAPALTPSVRTSLPIGNFLGALPATSLVAREHELTRIWSILDGVQKGQGNLLMLAGEPGVGKTRLAQEITLGARNRDFRVVTGRCYEPYVAVPFYPLHEAMTTAYGAAPTAVQNQVRQKWPYLSRLLPDQVLPQAPAALSSHEEQQRLFWSVTAFLQVLSDDAPVVVLLDDLQWADSSSIELVAHLVRHLRAHPILFVGTYRDMEVTHDHPLYRVVLDLGRERLTERIVVNRLPREGTAALIADAMGLGEIPDNIAALVHRHTDGNPFFSEELLRSLVERGDVYRQDGAWTPRAVDEIEVPESVRAVIWQRLELLSSETRGVLLQASVLGQSFQFDDVLALGSHGGEESQEDAEERLETALLEATQAGVLRSTGGESYSFNHTLTQQALYTELAPRRRRRLHLAAGEALERLPETRRTGRSAELASHFLQGGDPGRAFGYALKAGDAAEAVFAHDEAGTHYHTALRLSETMGDVTAEAQVRERLGSLLTATIKYSAALGMTEDAARLYAQVGDVVSESRVLAQLGRIHVVYGTVGAGISRLEGALESAGPELPAPARAGLHSSLANLYFAAGRFKESLQQAELAEAASIPSDGVAAEAAVRRGAALVMLGRSQDAETVLTSALERATGANDHFSRCRASQYLAGTYLLRREPDHATRCLSIAFELAERMGNPRQIAVSCFGLSLAALLAGDTSASSAHAERALSIMHSLEGSWATACQIGGFDEDLFSEEEWSLASQYLVECMTIARRQGAASQ